MGLRRNISYQWQLFIPLIATIWLIIFGMAYWQIYNEREYRKATLESQLKLINERIISYYENEKDPLEFFRFIGKYYIENPIYDKIRISVFQDGNLIYYVGEVISLSEEERRKTKGVTNNIHSQNSSLVIKTDGSLTAPIENEADELQNNNFFFRTDVSSDGRLRTSTVLPFDADVINASLPSTSIWIVVFVIATVLTILSYFSTRYFGRNIKILKTFAERAATDPNFIPSMDYPHDELGDISRQIIYMYNERSKAVLKLKREHNVTMHALEEKNRLKRQLTNNINHELKTPIGVIKGYLDTIISNPDMDEASRNNFIRKALMHANRLTNLMNDVSAITRLDEGGALINTEELDYHDLVYTVMSDLAESDILGDMEFVYDIPTDCIIRGNASLLSAMIMNLAKNAAAYSKGTECGVRLDGEDKNFYRFVFFDNGNGVGEEHLPHLFERFYRVDSGRSRKTGGTGLGLPIVQNTIHAHGGSIEVRNNPEGGLEFIYTLPKIKNSQQI